MIKITNIIHVIGRYRYIIVLVLAVIFLGFVGENCYMSHLQNQSTISELHENIDYYIELFNKDTEKLHLLDTDLNAIKQIARERYYMKSPNEDVFIFQD